MQPCCCGIVYLPCNHQKTENLALVLSRPLHPICHVTLPINLKLSARNISFEPLFWPSCQSQSNLDKNHHPSHPSSHPSLHVFQAWCLQLHLCRAFPQSPFLISNYSSNTAARLLQTQSQLLNAALLHCCSVLELILKIYWSLLTCVWVWSPVAKDNRWPLFYPTSSLRSFFPLIVFFSSFLAKGEGFCGQGPLSCPEDGLVLWVNSYRFQPKVHFKGFYVMCILLWNVESWL